MKATLVSSVLLLCLRQWALLVKAVTAPTLPTSEPVICRWALPRSMVTQFGVGRSPMDRHPDLPAPRGGHYCGPSNMAMSSPPTTRNQVSLINGGSVWTLMQFWICYSRPFSGLFICSLKIGFGTQISCLEFDECEEGLWLEAWQSFVRGLDQGCHWWMGQVGDWPGRPAGPMALAGFSLIALLSEHRAGHQAHGGLQGQTYRNEWDAHWGRPLPREYMGLLIVILILLQEKVTGSSNLPVGINVDFDS